MASVEIEFEFSDGSSEIQHFDGCSGVGGEVADYADDRAAELSAEAADLAAETSGDKDPDEITCDGWSIAGSDCSDYEDMEEPDGFDDLDEWGEYCDLVEKHGEAFVLRHADWSGHEDLDGYHGCWASEEEFAQNLYDDCIGGDNSMYCYIDWERYARDVMMDYSSYEGSEGIHIFSDH
jgi:antirestriction protein